MRSLLLVAAFTAVANAGPPEFAHFDPQRIVPAANGGVWLVGVDNCDEGGTTPAARWLGPGAQPATSPVPAHASRFDPVPVDPVLATLPVQLRERVRAVARSADAVDVYAAGLGGLIAVSTDAAQHWFVQTSNTHADLDAVWIRSHTEVYAAGANGTLVVARDGKPWTVDATLGKLVGADRTIFSVWGIDDDRYLAAGEVALASHDAGKTWAVMPGIAFYGIGGSSADTVYGFGGGFGGLSVSRDRGKTWERTASLWWSGHRCRGGS